MGQVERTILFTGFDPFGGETINPALEAIHELDGQVIVAGDASARIVTRALPTVFEESGTVLEHAIELLNPAVVICVGQAGGRPGITPERIAINLDDATMPDNAGHQPIDVPVVEVGPAAYFSTLPVKSIVSALREAGIPSSISNSAGTYVCNHIFYRLMHLLHTRHLQQNSGQSEADAGQSQVIGGFIHIPYLPIQTVSRNAPSMSLDLIGQGLTIAATVSLACLLET